MRWSKLRQLVEERVTPSLRPRFAIHSAAYGRCSCGHAWITLDKKVVANFCTRAFWNRKPDFDEDQGKWVPGPTPETLPKKVERFYAGQEVEYGEMSRQGAFHACWEFVHDLTIEEALVSKDVLVQSLAVLDARLGKRRLEKIEPDTLHPLARRFLAERVSSRRPRPSSSRESLDG